MKIRILVLLLGLPSFPALAAPLSQSLCKPGEKIIYSCQTARKKTASLCTSADYPDKRSRLQYRFGTASKIEMQFPDTPQPAEGRFFRSYTMYSGGYESHVRFSTDSYDYFYYDRMIRTGFKGQNLPKDSSGLVVRERSSGKEQHRACYPDAVETAGKDGLPETELETLNLPD